MSKAKKASNGPKIFYIDNDNYIEMISDYGPMTYKQAIKAAEEYIQDNINGGCGATKVKILKEVASVAPKSEKIELVVEEIK